MIIFVSLVLKGVAGRFGQSANWRMAVATKSDLYTILYQAFRKNIKCNRKPIQINGLEVRPILHAFSV